MPKSVTGPAALVDHNVAGLDIAVDDAVLVGIVAVREVEQAIVSASSRRSFP
jgi:hypothetical protein